MFYDMAVNLRANHPLQINEPMLWVITMWIGEIMLEVKPNIFDEISHPRVDDNDYSKTIWVRLTEWLLLKKREGGDSLCVLTPFNAI